MNDKSAILLLEMLVMTTPFRKRLLLKKHIRSLKEAVTQEEQRPLSKILQEKLTIYEIQGSTSTFELCWLETAGKFLQSLNK